MQTTTLIQTGALMLVASLLAAPLAPAETATEPLARITVSQGQVTWTPRTSDHRLVLTVTGRGLSFRRSFEDGRNPFFDLVDADGNRLPDGAYSWELRAFDESRATSASPANKLHPVAPTRSRGTRIEQPDRSQMLVQSGDLMIRNGTFETSVSGSDAGRARGGGLFSN